MGPRKSVKSPSSPSVGHQTSQTRAVVSDKALAGVKRTTDGTSRQRNGGSALTEAKKGSVTQKRKVSLTLDADVVEALEMEPGPLSTTANDVLRVALAQRHLGELVQQMHEESGPATPEARERILSAWLADR